ncbi:MAG: penicillin acylase family protein, partial [Gemmatimonadota bacterium]|nr:penicillin acylase family protein [Gemmatimonadota bacterium]MDE3005745.1 penicillin acylase family protein [Gemmatimonadota bacterium]MDE3015121.1 penicillin acylase family protein [Gemmatimonadota bacterium]
MNALLKIAGPTAVLAVGLHLGARATGPLPALGAFLDPVHGIWAVARSAEFPASARAVIPGLGSDVEVIYDERRVPHIFAPTRADLNRALGYVIAKDRLFQLELQARATAGTLTQLLGERLLSVDRQSRGLGLAWAAERDWERIQNDPELAEPLIAYAEGINAFIDAMGPEDIPFEFHLLGRTPMRWKPEYTLYLLKRMGWTLAYSNVELRKAWLASKVGRVAADGLIPRNSPIQEPIQPHSGPRDLSVSIPPPGAPDADAAIQMESMQAFFGPMDLARDGDGRALGSNSWAVSASRSTTGEAILAGDPHLSMTLPSIWYEAHLVVPGEMDVYGVTFAGTPAIVIGFNRDVAWTFTNTGSDVMDYYRERVDDPEAPTRYRLDGEWLPLEKRIEEFRGPNGDLLAVDTIRHTHRGPMTEVEGDYVSLRWTVLEDQGEIGPLLRINMAESVEEWLGVMSTWHAPTQNGLVADRNGRVAIRSAGRYPIRPERATGDWFFDGSTTESDWQGWLPVERYPQAIDPSQGYLASANQQPIDPEADDIFIGADWPAPWRALTINALLRSKVKHSPDDLDRYQTFPGSARADRLVPAFVAAVDALSERNQANPDMEAGAELLAGWERHYTRDDGVAIFFESAVEALEDRLWDELRDEDAPRTLTPGTDLVAALIEDPDSPWWDVRETDHVETRDEVLAMSLAEALVGQRERLGPEGSDTWQWSKHRKANILHLMQLPALSRMDIPVQGGPGLLNPSSGDGRHGPSWRMVVSLGDEVRARGTYPGGQSGNPVSRGYADRLDSWADGALEPLLFPRSPSELESQGLTRSRLLLSPGGER